MAKRKTRDLWHCCSNAVTPKPAGVLDDVPECKEINNNFAEVTTNQDYSSWILSVLKKKLILFDAKIFKWRFVFALVLDLYELGQGVGRRWCKASWQFWFEGAKKNQHCFMGAWLLRFQKFSSCFWEEFMGKSVPVKRCRLNLFPATLSHGTWWLEDVERVS